MPLKLFIITENSRRVISGTLCPVVPWLEKQRAGKVVGQKEAGCDGTTREGHGFRLGVAGEASGAGKARAEAGTKDWRPAQAEVALTH